MVPFGAVPRLCLKIGMETFQIISMEHKISQARLAHVKSKNQYFVYFGQDRWMLSFSSILNKIVKDSIEALHYCKIDVKIVKNV